MVSPKIERPAGISLRADDPAHENWRTYQSWRASAKTSFATKDTEYRGAAADLILLDRTMAHYGPETENTRDLLRGANARIFWSRVKPLLVTLRRITF
jgi:hypothetical protein